MKHETLDRSLAPPITDAATLAALCEKLSLEEIISFDTEFIRERTYYPEIALIQVGNETETWLVDPLVLDEQAMRPLLDLFQNPKILKILHAAQGDQECIFLSYGVTASPTFDTAQGAALLGYGDNVGLAKILKEVLKVNLEKGHARTDWKVRPLPDHLLKYAHADVKYLVPAAKKMLATLETRKRKDWALELSRKWEDHKCFQFDAVNAALRIAKGGRLDERALAALTELLAWRDKRASDIDIPRRRVMDDDVIVDLARVRPQTLEHLASFRGFSKGELNKSGAFLVEIFQKVSKLNSEQLPQIPRSPIPTNREARCMDVINLFLKILADKHDIVARHLLSSDDMLKMVRGKHGSVQDIIDCGALTPGSAELIGEDLLAILQGHKKLSLRDASGGLDVHLEVV